jgi:hypothetical protein
MSLTPEAEGELATDLAAVDALLRLFPQDVPDSMTLRIRLADTPKYAERERRFFEGYLDRVRHAELRGAA